MTRRKAFVAIVGDDTDDEDIDHITSYCEKCRSWGFLQKLGPRIYPKNELIPYDSHLWRQCHRCGGIVPVINLKHENEIEGVKSVPDNIHDSGKVAIATTHKRSSSHAKSREVLDFIKRTRPGANRSKDYVDVDLDIRSHLNSGKQLVSYQSDNDEFEG